LTPAPDRAQFELLRLLHCHPQHSQRSAASSLGMSVGKLNYCLHALIGRGLVKAQNFRTSKNKLSYLYLLTAAGVAMKAELTRMFLEQKVREYERLRVEIEQLTIESHNEA
jgi:EPS-associated MarR family transcriptional regulator